MIYYPPIPSLYDDKEVCKMVDCKIYKSLQLISRPSSVGGIDYVNYSNKF